jgi:hypothetical protein
VSARRLRFTVCATQLKLARKRESDFVTHASLRCNFLMSRSEIFLKSSARSPAIWCDYFAKIDCFKNPAHQLLVVTRDARPAISAAWGDKINLLTTMFDGRKL